MSSTPLPARTAGPNPRSSHFFTSRTPFRVSFFGGGTDYPKWYRQHGGAVLSTSIDKYCYISGRWLPHFHPSTYRIVWSHIETVTSVSEILHPAVREGLRMFDFQDNQGVELHHQADLPARTGVGSSSAFAVGLINILTSLLGSPLNKTELFLKAMELEQDWLKEAVGSQDQVATAVGGLNVIRFNTDGSIQVEPVPIATERRAALQGRLLMFYTGLSRTGPALAQKIINSLDSKTDNLRRMQSMVETARDLLSGAGDLDDFGHMLDEAWRLKRSLADQISNPRIDGYYEAALQAGALGGKLLGAGSSGFLLFYVPPDRQDAVRATMAPLLEIPFGFDTEGSVLLNSNLQ